MGRNLGYGGTNARMLRSQLRSLDGEAERLLALVKDGDTLPDWVLSKITVALDRVTVARQYVESKLKAMKKNPRTIKTKMVEPDRLQFRGFNRKKIQAIRPHIPLVLNEARRRMRTKRKFPTPIVAMSPEEIYDGVKTVDAAHPSGAGHGLYFIDYQLVKINKDMEPIDLLANVLHENIHHLDPKLSEMKVRQMTGDIMEYCTGVRTYGQPFVKNPSVRRNFKDTYAKQAIKTTAGGMVDQYGYFVPKKYYAGVPKSKVKARIKELGDRRKELRDAKGKDLTPAQVEHLYRPYEQIEGVKTRSSSYSVEARKRGFGGGWSKIIYKSTKKRKADSPSQIARKKRKNRAKVQNALSYYDVPQTKKNIDLVMDLLNQVYAKGLAAWATSGSRTNASQHAWAGARVDSFLVGGPTFSMRSADATLADQLPSKLRQGIKEQSTGKL